MSALDTIVTAPLPPDHQDVFAFTAHKNFNSDTFVPNLKQFCDRIQYDGPLIPTLDVLKSLQFHFILTFPFENLSIHGLSHISPNDNDYVSTIPVSMNPAIIEDKLLRQGRGGYCFEMNQYFSCVLRAVGFTIATKSARVLWRFEPGFAQARTHLVTLVWLDNTRYLCDVAFGANSSPIPLQLDNDAPQSCLYDTYRIVPMPSPHPRHHKVLQIRCNEAVNEPVGDKGCPEWLDMYYFDEHEISTVADWEQASFQVCMYRPGLFVSHMLIGFTTLQGRLALFDNKFVYKRLLRGVSADTLTVPTADSTFTTHSPFCKAIYGTFPCAFENVDETEITSVEHLVEILRTRFHIHIPDDKAASLRLIVGK